MANDYFQEVYEAHVEPPAKTSYYRRTDWYLITMSMWTALGVLETTLGLRFFLKLLGANPANGFAMFIYGITWLFTLPFAGILPNWVSDPRVFEVTTLLAMGVYWLFVWIAIRALRKYAAAR
jgi:YggT family protein